MNTELEVVNSGAVAKVESPETLILRAIDKGADVGVMERLVALRDKFKAEQAKEAFDRAMADLQAEMPIVRKDTEVKAGGGDKLYSYTPFEHIIPQVKEYIRKHGFSWSLNTDTESKDGWVIATCEAKHSGGHSETSKVKLPIGAGTRAMSQTQVYAAAISFASRRAFCNAFGIVTAGEDKDGIGQGPKPPGAKSDDLQKLKGELWELLKPVRGTEINWNMADRWLIDECCMDPSETVKRMTAERVAQVIANAKGKL